MDFRSPTEVQALPGSILSSTLYIWSLYLCDNYSLRATHTREPIKFVCSNDDTVELSGSINHALSSTVAITVVTNVNILLSFRIDRSAADDVAARS